MTDEQMLQYLKDAHAQKVTYLGRDPSKYATLFSLAANRIETLEAKLDAVEAMLAEAEQRARGQAFDAVILTIMEHNMRYGINDGHNDLTDEISAMKGR